MAATAPRPAAEMPPDAEDAAATMGWSAPPPATDELNLAARAEAVRAEAGDVTRRWAPIALSELDGLDDDLA
ncbi:hypothetical protein I6A84_18160 [Frankia sp. CNm7]|nr:hypothetical protein [Frankia nepalensis]